MSDIEIKKHTDNLNNHINALKTSKETNELLLINNNIKMENQFLDSLIQVKSSKFEENSVSNNNIDMSQEQNNNIVFIKEHENKLLNKNKIIKSKNHKSIVSNNVQIKKKI